MYNSKRTNKERFNAMVRIKIKQIINITALVLLVLTVVTNPLTSQYIIELFVRSMVYISREVGVQITTVSGTFFIGYILWNMWLNRDITKVPPKTAKTKPQKYITTN